MNDKHIVTRVGRSQWFDEKTGEPVSPERHKEIDAHYERLMREQMKLLAKELEA